MTISTLQEVQTWLGTLTAGTTVSVGSTLFDSAMVSAVFKILPPGDDPISLAVTGIDVDNATLAGAAAVIGEDETTVVSLIFTQPATTLLLELDVTPPATVAWTLIPPTTWNVWFDTISARFLPNTDVDNVNLLLHATLHAGDIALELDLNVPCYDGDWLVQGTFDPQTGFSADDLQTLAGGNDVLSLLQGYFDLDHFSITDLEFSFNPYAAGAPTCSMIRIGLGYATEWTFFNDAFKVDGITFNVELFDPFAESPSVQGLLFATMEIPAGGQQFEVGGQFPDNAVFAQLAPGSALKVSDAFSFFQVTPPSELAGIEIDILSFWFWPADEDFSFELGIVDQFPIVGDVHLNNFSVALNVAYADGTFTGSGTLDAGLTIGPDTDTPTTIALAGAYASGQGLSLSGSATDVDVGAIVAGIASQFGVDPSSIPQAVQNIELQSVGVTLTTGDTKSFHFAFTGTTTIAGTSAQFSPTIDLQYASNDDGTSGFHATFAGTLMLQTPGGVTITFGLSYTGNTITATYTDTGTGLTFEDIAAVFGFLPPPIPPGLDLDLTSATFLYDFDTKTLAFGALSASYGELAYVNLPLDDATQNFVVLGTGRSFSLSNLPLVGDELAQIENIQISNLDVVITSMSPVSATDAGTVNTVIATLGSTYPQLPSGGFDGSFLLAGNLAIGDVTYPLSVALGGSDDQDAVATAGSSGSGTTLGGTMWFTIQRTFGPVSLQRIGASYQPTTQTLWFELDASLTFGPLTLSLVGLGIGSPLTTFAPQFSLGGLGIDYDNPPLTIAGTLVNLAGPGASSIEFEGGVTITTGQFTLQAFGYFGNQNGFNSLFLYADVGYPFGGPPAFFVTGAAVGFGYNSTVTIPTIDQVGAFPFVQVLPNSVPAPQPGLLGNDPASVLATLLDPPPWVAQSAGSLWFAAGITFTSFDLVKSQALAVVDTGSQLVIALVGTSQAQFPQASDVDSGDPGEVYAYILVDLVARIAPAQGVFSLQAQLAPSSYLLTQACVLTGGLAFFVWYSPSPYAGDFVFTLGGYNPGFTPPTYYPSVPAVGFHWSIDSSITIAGGLYFALTPSVLMVGGELEATYESGNLSAWFDAQADVIIRWKPFYFVADIGITVGATYLLDLLFTTVPITVELGCTLDLWGPPTGGSVTVDWYVISFTIPFGTPQGTGNHIGGWSDFETMLPNTAPPGSPINVLTISPVAGITPTNTSPPPSDPPTTDPPPPPPAWIVRASQFAFTTSTPIPASSAAVGNTSFAGSTFDVYPLGWTDISATHVLGITTTGGGDFTSSFEAAPVLGNVPSALWRSQTGGVPDGSDQLVPNQLTGMAVNVFPPQIGESAGPIDVAVNLSGTSLGLAGANLPIDNSDDSQGDLPVNSQSTVAVIAAGIDLPDTQSSRNAIFATLQSLGYAPVTANDPMTHFAAGAGCSFAAEPLLVS